MTLREVLTLTMSQVDVSSTSLQTGPWICTMGSVGSSEFKSWCIITDHVQQEPGEHPSQQFPLLESWDQSITASLPQKDVMLRRPWPSISISGDMQTTQRLQPDSVSSSVLFIHSFFSSCVLLVKTCLLLFHSCLHTVYQSSRPLLCLVFLWRAINADKRECSRSLRNLCYNLAVRCCFMV